MDVGGNKKNYYSSPLCLLVHKPEGGCLKCVAALYIEVAHRWGEEGLTSNQPLLITALGPNHAKINPPI